MARLLLIVFLTLSAAAAEVRFTREPAGKAVVSFVADASPSAAAPLWIHLHGATDTVERAFAQVGAPGVLVTLTLPGLSKVYADHFAPPEAFENLLREAAAIVRRARGGGEWTPAHITVSSFSAGFGGVRQLLRQPAAFERIGTLVMADSIYCGYAGPVVERQVDPALMEGFLRYARLAADGKRRMLITHTRQVPEGYASTTETADYLISQLGGGRAGRGAEWGDGLVETGRFSRAGFEVIGFEGAEAKDHLQHLRSLGDRKSTRLNSSH